MIANRPSTVRPAVLRAAGLAVAVGVGLSACSAAGSASDSDSNQARELAGQLNDNLAEAGLPALDTSTATTLYGTDGGVSCENSGDLQQQLGLSQFGNNSGNLRRVVMDPSIIAYDRAVIETYCPNELSSFQDLVDELDTAETIQTP